MRVGAASSGAHLQLLCWCCCCMLCLGGCCAGVSLEEETAVCWLGTVCCTLVEGGLCGNAEFAVTGTRGVRGC